jgi:hypothetical protein
MYKMNLIEIVWDFVSGVVFGIVVSCLSYFISIILVMLTVKDQVSSS